MKALIDLPAPLFQEVQARAFQQGLGAKDLVVSYIEAGLSDSSWNPANAAAHKRSPLPIARRANGSVSPSLNNQQLHALLDAEDLAHYQKVVG